MMITQTIVNVEKVQEILEKLAIEIYSSCKVIDITDNSEFQKNASFEVSYTNGN